MAITPTISAAPGESDIKPERFGTRIESRVGLALSGTYVTGGFDLSGQATQAGLDRLSYVKDVSLTDGTDYLVGHYDYANSKLILTDGGAQVANTTSLSSFDGVATLVD